MRGKIECIVINISPWKPELSLTNSVKESIFNDKLSRNVSRKIIMKINFIGKVIFYYYKF